MKNDQSSPFNLAIGCRVNESYSAWSNHLNVSGLISAMSVHTSLYCSVVCGLENRGNKNYFHSLLDFCLDFHKIDWKGKRKVYAYIRDIKRYGDKLATPGAGGDMMSIIVDVNRMLE